MCVYFVAILENKGQHSKIAIKPICLSHCTTVGLLGLTIYGFFSNSIVPGGEGKLFKTQSTVE